MLRRKLSETSAGKKRRRKKKTGKKSDEMQHSDKVSVRRDVEGVRARAGCRVRGGVPKKTNEK